MDTLLIKIIIKPNVYPMWALLLMPNVYPNWECIIRPNVYPNWELIIKPNVYPHWALHMHAQCMHMVGTTYSCPMHAQSCGHEIGYE